MCRVVLADDEHLEIEALKIIINEKVKNVDIVGEAYNGEDVIKINESLNPDVIFMDIIMPGIDGLEVAQIIKEKDSSKKIVLMSVYDDFELVQRALKIKVDDYLLKPIKPEKVIMLLKEFIDEDKIFNSENNISVYKIDELECALSYIEKNFRKNITLNEVANYVNFSSTYLSKLFKNNIGINFNKYITKRRIKEATLILENKNISVNDLAFQIGYNEPSYFCKVFKKEKGVTPLEYRKKVNNKKV
ncbi:DNA-binding response regulator [Clostridium tetani]|uniref:Stage 0 sporulation protein A homolog n=2 Tax=Clostridium tetani TaxID=1513 RepID=Q896R3_CLOTE|nr:response regulator [Clostridium tetani]AAO35527.1 transcriptional regulatory protein [Clostridium tetani E88]AVP54354.1 DNA-binding response regulator [Clostridium tetani]KGI37077.1 transcriptional regulator [Clostridium tetani]KGI40468.1 transcriptional regulator [Clostridium tetani ATCC 9441]KGI42349.1 transcriptional regulator [Clostridium tetani]